MNDKWPDGVKGISFDNLGLLGVHEETKELYWDGEKIVTQKPITLGVFERIVASFAAVSAVVLAAVEVGRSCGWWGG